MSKTPKRPEHKAGVHQMTPSSLQGDDLFTWTPPRWTRARKGGPDTSAEAAPSAARVRTSWQPVGASLSAAGGPLTAEENTARIIAAGGRWTPQRLNTALSEMERAGLVERADRGGITATGHAAYRWQLTDKGHATFAAGGDDGGA